MNLSSIRLITADVARLTDFYELVTGVAARRPTPLFAEIVTPGATLAIGALETVPFLDPVRTSAPAPLEPARTAAGTAVVEFEVADTDAEFARLRESIREFVLEPTTMPWGNRSMLFRDPDGTLVNVFTRPAVQ